MAGVQWIDGGRDGYLRKTYEDDDIDRLHCLVWGPDEDRYEQYVSLCNKSYDVDDDVEYDSETDTDEIKVCLQFLSWYPAFHSSVLCCRRHITEMNTIGRNSQMTKSTTFTVVNGATRKMHTRPTRGYANIATQTLSSQQKWSRCVSIPPPSAVSPYNLHFPPSVFCPLIFGMAAARWRVWCRVA